MGDKQSTPNDSFAAEVTSVVDAFEKVDGKLTLPEDFEASDQAIYAAKIEVRRRDTYSSLSKTNNENVALKAENTAMAAQWEEDAMDNLSDAERADLAELKATDPDAYIAKRAEHTEAAKEQFGTRRAKVKETAEKESEIDRRTRLVEEYNLANPGAELTDDVIENDVPPRITKQLASGDITFDEFLDKASTYLKSGKVIEPGAKTDKQVNLSKAGGSSKPEERAVEADIKETYKNTVF